jgi:hypothetical protein
MEEVYSLHNRHTEHPLPIPPLARSKTVSAGLSGVLTALHAMYRTPRHVAPPLFLRGSLDRVGLPLRAHYSKVGCESDWPGSSRWTPSREPRRRFRFLAHLPRGLATGPVVGDGSGLAPALPSVRRPSGANSGQSLSKSLFRTGGVQGRPRSKRDRKPHCHACDVRATLFRSRRPVHGGVHAIRRVHHGSGDDSAMGAAIEPGAAG